MVTPLTPPSAADRRRLSRQAQRDTRPELMLRRELHKRGLRYFVDRRPVPSLRRRADLIFPRLHIAVFVDGCFWHCCPIHGTTPKSNRDWWINKLKLNVHRDRDTDSRLELAGWTVLRFWEHANVLETADEIEGCVRSCGCRKPHP